MEKKAALNDDRLGYHESVKMGFDLTKLTA
jgi:hypothetical protein